jgi:hypothetical protein
VKELLFLRAKQSLQYPVQGDEEQQDGFDFVRYQARILKDDIMIFQGKSN